MKIPYFFSASRFALALVSASALVLTSCKLPPREVLTQIQRDTLVGYIAKNHEKSGIMDSGPLARENGYPVEDSTYGTAPRELPDVSVGVISGQRAEPVPGKPGFVYSPHTARRLMVDVRNFSSGDQVLCPYTRRPFTIPSPLVDSEGPGVSSGIMARNDVAPRMVPAEIVSPSVSRTGTGGNAVASGPSTRPLTPLQRDIDPGKPIDGGRETPRKIDSGNGNRKSGDPAKTAANADPKPDEKPAPSTDDTLPYGTRIPGKPNFVYSPFASKSQVVNVAGFTPGTKVRCPYTGKLFRVPAAADGGSQPDVESAPKKESAPAGGTTDGEKAKKTSAAADTKATPTAKWAREKPGYVESPYGNYKVDVRGKKPGSIVLCPFSGKPFRLPTA